MCDCGDGPTVHREKTRIARRKHTCCECRGVINPGESYHFLWGVWDGEAKTFKTCSECIHFAAVMRDENDCFCPHLGNLHVDALDYVSESGDNALIAECKARIAEIKLNRRRLTAA